MAANKKKTDENGDALVSGEVLSQLLGREPFSYDVNADGLYRKYRDTYAREGRRAMKDTIGRASAMTGGYGNTYAETAGQAAYENSLAKADAMIPELYRLAEERYRAETDALRDRYALLYEREKDRAAADAAAEESRRRQLAEEAAAARQERLDRQAAEKAEEELALKRAAQTLNERKADDARAESENKTALSRAELEAKIAYNDASLAAKREKDRGDYEVGMAKAAGGVANPLSGIRYGKLGIREITDLQSLIGYVRGAASKTGTLKAANRYVDAWLAAKRADGALTDGAAEELRYYLSFGASDLPKNRGVKAREVVK